MSELVATRTGSVWDDDDTASVFGDGKWTDCAGEIPAERTPGAVGVAVSVDLSSSAVVLAARSGERAIPLDAIKKAKLVLTDELLAALLDKIGPAIILVHSQSGDYGIGVPELRPDSRYNLDNDFVIRNYSTSSDVLVVMAYLK